MTGNTTGRPKAVRRATGKQPDKFRKTGDNEELPDADDASSSEGLEAVAPAGEGSGAGASSGLGGELARAVGPPGTELTEVASALGAAAANPVVPQAAVSGAVAMAPAEDPLVAIQRQLAALSPLVPMVTAMAAQVQELHNGYQRLTNMVAERGDRLDMQAGAIRANQGRIEALEQKVQQLSVAPDVPRPPVAAEAAPAPPVPAASEVGLAPPGFTPAFVEARGWCKFQDRSTKGLTKAQCSSILATLKTHLDPGVAARVGDVQVRGLRNHVFRFPVQGGAGTCMEVSGVANDLVKVGQVGLPDTYENREALRFSAERSPEDQTKMAAMLRILRAAEKTIADKTAAGEAQWAGITASPNWREHAVELPGFQGGLLVLCAIGQGGVH